MAKVDIAPIPKDDKEAVIASLEAYKKQNPEKYEAKKEALFKRYGLNVEDEKVEVPDASDVELAEIKKKVTKAKNAK